MNAYGTVLKQLIQLTGSKLSTISDVIGYDVSYISKWCNKSMLPAAKMAPEINRSMASLFAQEILSQENIKDFEKTLGNIDIDGLKITKEKAANQGSSAPTKLKNPLIFRPFEMFVRMYGVPGYGEFDPTTIVALTYSLFFGIMFGDLGQGLCVSLIGLLAWKLKKLELGKIMIPIGIFSAGFGVVYDSVFGYEGVLSRLIFGEERELVFTPSNHMMPALGITIAIGVVFIAVAMIMNIINSFKRKDLENALFGPNGLAGLIFYCALIGGLVGPILGMFSDISFNLLSTPYIVGLSAQHAAWEQNAQ